MTLFEQTLEMMLRLRNCYDALEDIRHHLPYPSDYKGQKVEGGEWSLPPSTRRQLEQIVGTRVEPSDILIAAREALG